MAFLVLLLQMCIFSIAHSVRDLFRFLSCLRDGKLLKCVSCQFHLVFLNNSLLNVPSAHLVISTSDMLRLSYNSLYTACLKFEWAKLNRSRRHFRRFWRVPLWISGVNFTFRRVFYGIVYIKINIKFFELEITTRHLTLESEYDLTSLEVPSLVLSIDIL